MTARPVRACLITNPRGGRGALDLTDALPVLRAAGWEVVVRQKDHGGAATEIARAAAAEGCDVVVDCGGDGTLNEIVAGLVGTDVAVGVLPGGTVNLWANELGIDGRLRIAATQLVGAVRHRVDVGCVTANGAHAQYFLLVAGLGLDGAVMARVSKPLKKRLGQVAVGLAALQALPSFSSFPVRARLDDLPWEGRVAQIIVGNTRRYGGFTAATPAALADDGQLDVCLIRADGLLAAGRQLGALVFAGHPSKDSAETYRVARATVAAAQPLPLQLDGGDGTIDDLDAGAEGVTYAFSTIARGISVLVPRTYDGTLFRAGTAAEAPPAAPRPGQGRKGRWLRVLAVGAETITAARVKDGRVVTIAAGRKVVAKDAGKARQPWPDFLAGLVPGDLLRVRGRRDRRRGRIRARRARLYRPENAGQ